MTMPNNSAAVKSRLDLVDFIRNLRQYLRDHPESWENRDLDSFLEAMAAWTEEMDGYFSGVGEPVPVEPTWSLIAQIMTAAIIYE